MPVLLSCSIKMQNHEREEVKWLSQRFPARVTALFKDSTLLFLYRTGWAVIMLLINTTSKWEWLPRGKQISPHVTFLYIFNNSFFGRVWYAGGGAIRIGKELQIIKVENRKSNLQVEPLKLAHFGCKLQFWQRCLDYWYSWRNSFLSALVYWLTLISIMVFCTIKAL